MPKKQKALFVCYGGGHGKMCLPVAKELETIHGFKTHTLALSTAFDLFRREGLDCSHYSSYLAEDNHAAKAFGLKLAENDHNPQSGIALDESIAYLGLSFQDLVSKLGESAAWTKYSQEGRHAFCQNSVLRSVIELQQPDIVITTNSPRSEKAAVEEAKKLGILTLSMCDLFGRLHFHPLESDHITVLSGETIKNLRAEGVANSVFHITGNPAFDQILKFKTIAKNKSRNELGIDLKKKIILFADMPAYWDVDRLKFHKRSSQEITRDLESIFSAAKKLNFSLIVRPHPSQTRDLYVEWIANKNDSSVVFDPGYDLHHVLNAADSVIGYTTTVLLEAALIGTTTIQFKFAKAKSDMPLGEMGIAHLVTSYPELTPALESVVSLAKSKEENLKLIDRHIPATAAAPRIATLINDLLNDTRLPSA